MKRIAPALCAALLLAGTAVWAQPGHFHGGPGGQAAAMTQYLGLTDTQQAALQPAHQKLRDTVKPLFDEMRQKRQAIKDGLDKNADAATLGQLLIETNKLRQQVKAAHDAFEQELTAQLTPDQAAKYQSFRELRQSFHHGHGADPGAAVPPAFR